MKSQKVAYSSVLLGVLIASSVMPCFAGFRQQHPRRAEVLQRDRNLNRQIGKNYGNLGGNYGKLSRQDARIHNEQQRMSQKNGGYITNKQMYHLNRQESRLRQQVRTDKGLPPQQ